MLDLTIRPTAKFIIVRTVIAMLIFLAVEIVWYMKWREQESLHFLPMVAPLIFVSPALRALRRQFTTVSVSGDRLRLEMGAFSKSSRTIQLSKMQDVRVDQSMTQRMFGVGNISIETAGESSRLTIPDVDRPQAVADQLLDRAHQGSTPGGTPGSTPGGTPGGTPFGTPGSTPASTPGRAPRGTPGSAE